MVAPMFVESIDPSLTFGPSGLGFSLQASRFLSVFRRPQSWRQLTAAVTGISSLGVRLIQFPHTGKLHIVRTRKFCPTRIFLAVLIG
jgi:hypothetical protein